MRQSKYFFQCGIGILILALGILSGGHPLPCHAEETVPKGSIRVDFRAEAAKIPLAGAEVRIYRVADIRAYTDELRYIYTEEFADCAVDFTRAGQAENASGIFQYIEEKGIGGVSAVTDQDGRVAFDALEQGLYLVAQIGTADGFSRSEPFLVSIPYLEDGSLRYDVDATPKVALEYHLAPVVPTPPPALVVPGTGNSVSGSQSSGSQSSDTQSSGSQSSGTQSSDTQSSGSQNSGAQAEHVQSVDDPDRKLPQTGQIWWPVPLLMSMGFLFLIIGLWSRKEK